MKACANPLRMRGAGVKQLVLGVPLVLLAGCASNEKVATASVPSPVREVAHGAARRSAISPANYVATASSIELYEIQSAELALQRARTKRVRDFASMLLQSHRGASMQLSLAGRRLNLLPSATLDPTHQAMMEQLRSAADFDAVYRAQQIAVNREALAIHQDYAALGTSPTLRPVAASLVPVFQRSLRALRSL